jgi:hypothetical protein
VKNQVGEKNTKRKTPREREGEEKKSVEIV